MSHAVCLISFLGCVRHERSNSGKTAGRGLSVSSSSSSSLLAGHRSKLSMGYPTLLDSEIHIADRCLAAQYPTSSSRNLTQHQATSHPNLKKEDVRPERDRRGVQGDHQEVVQIWGGGDHREREIISYTGSGVACICMCIAVSAC